MYVVCLALLFTSTIVFLGSAVALMFLAKSRPRPESSEPQTSIGLMARGYFLGIWGFAHVTRGCSSGAQIFMCSGAGCPGGWGCRLLRALADLPFCSAYFLFVFFLGHLSYTASGVSGSSFLRLFPVFALSNALFYLCVLAVTGVCLALGDTPGAETAGNAVLYIMGSAYVLAVVLLLYYSRRLRAIIRPSLFLVPAGLMTLLNRLCVLLGCVFVAQAAHFFAAASGATDIFIRRAIKCEDVCVTDFVFNILFELAPSIVGMFLLQLVPCKNPVVTSYSSIA